MPEPCQAIVFGAKGGIGAAIMRALVARAEISQSIGFGRSELETTSEASIEAAVTKIKATGIATRLIVVATGFLHDQTHMPEKSLKELSSEALVRSFEMNTVGPALLMKYFLPLLPRHGRAVFATLSARVGSIADNDLGGWYSYRASKAALNQTIRTAAIELRRSRPQAICVALHPGTVATPLSAPFAKSGLDVRSPETAANDLLNVIARLTPEANGGFFDHRGEAIPW